jgi:tRNA threonylcarbamoyl adenosine modification protein (Sua5/YciO/YrdC/YwlC family)
MSARFDCADPAQLLQGLAEAEAALRRGELVVMPTDTVYGIAAEAFDPVAVELLLKAKGRGRDMPPPVLVGTVRAAMALVMDLGDVGKDLIDEFWPGGLTIVCRSSPTLVWDLGETKGTVAVRMPLHQVALDLLKRTGPLAVSSANVSGRPAATTADEAMAQLGDAVAVYLDDGPCAADVPSTIVDLTGSVPRLLRQGVITVERLREVIPLALEDEALADEVPGVEVPGDEEPGVDEPGDEVPGVEVPGDEAPGNEAPRDEMPGDGMPGDGLSGHAIPEGGISGDENGIPGDENFQETGKAAPAGPADPVSADTGDPGVVPPSAEDAADQGNPADRDATG